MICECGAWKAEQPGHSFWCQCFEKTHYQCFNMLDGKRAYYVTNDTLKIDYGKNSLNYISYNKTIGTVESFRNYVSNGNIPDIVFIERQADPQRDLFYEISFALTNTTIYYI